MNTFEGYMADHPELKLVEGSSDKDLLLWANKKKYIVLRVVEGHRLYTDFQLGVAKMWSTKDDSFSGVRKTWNLLVKYKGKEEFVLYESYRTEGDAVAMGHMLIQDKNSDIMEYTVERNETR